VSSNGVVASAAASNDFAAAADRIQISANEGPGIDACRSGTTMDAPDLRTDRRWPAFAAAGAAAGVRSIVAFALSSPAGSSLTLYGRRPEVFGGIDRGSSHVFATLARLALESAETRAAGDKRAEDLAEALRTRELIGQAQGILMERERVTGDQAFGLLRRASQRRNRRLRDVAQELVETGEFPDPGRN